MPINRLLQVLNEKEFSVTLTKLELIAIRELIDFHLDRFTGGGEFYKKIESIEDKIDKILDSDCD